MQRIKIENVKILGCNVKVKYFDNLHRSDCDMGRCDSKMNIILVNAEMPEDVQRQTLLHEIMHKLSDDLSLNLTEDQVSALSVTVFGVLTDNAGII